jgi:hypothetical protein
MLYDPAWEQEKKVEEKVEEKKQNSWAIKDTLLDIINKLKPNKNGSQTQAKEAVIFSMFKKKA